MLADLRRERLQSTRLKSVASSCWRDKHQLSVRAGGSKQSAQDVAGGADHKVRDLETRLASTERSLKTLELLKRSG